MAQTESDVIIQLDGGIAVRRYRDSDVELIIQHANNPNVTRNLRNRFPSPYTVEDSRTWIGITRNPDNHARSGKWTPEGGAEGPLTTTNYVITINDEPVGGIGVDLGSDVYFRTGEIGYWLGEQHWGKGIMSKVAKAFVDWTWQTFGILVRLNATTFEHNTFSGSILKKAGFVYEARQENMVYKDGKLGAQLLFFQLRPSHYEVD